MDEETEIHRGNDARNLLQNPLLVEAFAAIKARQHKAIEDSLLSGGERREHAYLIIMAVKEVEAHLTSYVTTGKMASKARSEREEIEERERELAEWDGSPDGPTSTRHP